MVVIDSGRPRNAEAEGVNGFLTRDGTSPSEFIAAARREVTGYGAQILEGTVTSVQRSVNGFVVSLADGVACMPASSSRDRTGRRAPGRGRTEQALGTRCHPVPLLPRMGGARQAIGVLAHPALPVEQALLFSQWSPFVTLFTYESRALTDEERERLDARSITVVEAAVGRLKVEDERLVGVRLADGTLVQLDVFALEPRFTARADLLAELGVIADDHPMGEAWPAAHPPKASYLASGWPAT